MNLKAFTLQLVILALLAACQRTTPAPAPVSPTASLDEKTATPLPGTFATEAPSAPRPSAPLPSAPLPSALSPAPLLPPSPLLYIAENRLIEQSSDGATRVLASLAGAGAVYDALRAGEQVFVLRESGLERLRLGDGQGELVAPFEDPPVYGGPLRLSADGQRLVYALAVEAPAEPLGFGTVLQAYALQGGAAAVVYSGPNAELLGFSADGQRLYLVPRGGDASFGELWQFSLAAGEIEARLVLDNQALREAGYGGAWLAPGGRFLAYTTQRFVAGEAPLEMGLVLLDFATQPPAVHRLALPEPPSHLDTGSWDPDGAALLPQSAQGAVLLPQSAQGAVPGAGDGALSHAPGNFYFLLQSGSGFDGQEPRPLGLWRLDPQAGVFEKVAEVDQPSLHVAGFTPDGQWAILQPETEPFLKFLHLDSGAWADVSLPPGAVMVREAAWSADR
jgi:hypothetical protein